MANAGTTVRRVRAPEGSEVWETTVAGRIWLEVHDDRGRPKQISLGPNKIGMRATIKTTDREEMQEQIYVEADDPFRNGMLVRVDADQQGDPDTASEQVRSNDDLTRLFAKTGNAFQSAVRELNELNARRLVDIAQEIDAKASQVNFLAEYIKETYGKGGDTPSYRELKGIGEVASGTNPNPTR